MCKFYTVYISIFLKNHIFVQMSDLLYDFLLKIRNKKNPKPSKIQISTPEKASY